MQGKKKEKKRLMHSNPETNRKNMSVTPPGGGGGVMRWCREVRQTKIDMQCLFRYSYLWKNCVTLSLIHVFKLMIGSSRMIFSLWIWTQQLNILLTRTAFHWKKSHTLTSHAIRLAVSQWTVLYAETSQSRIHNHVALSSCAATF